MSIEVPTIFATLILLGLIAFVIAYENTHAQILVDDVILYYLIFTFFNFIIFRSSPPLRVCLDMFKLLMLGIITYVLEFWVFVFP